MSIRIRIRLSILLIPIQIRNQILPQVLHMLENQNFFTFNHSSTSLYLSHQPPRNDNFQYFDSKLQLSGQNFNLTLHLV
jgi:hypothetical protein